MFQWLQYADKHTLLLRRHNPISRYHRSSHFPHHDLFFFFLPFDPIPNASFLYFLVSDYDYFSMAGDQEPEPQQMDFDKSSTIPRNSDISHSYRQMFQSKRPASTAGLPSTQVLYPSQGAYSTMPYPSTPLHTGAYPPLSAGTRASVLPAFSIK